MLRAGLLCALLLPAPFAAAQDNQYKALLQARGIPATREGIGEFLRRSIPDENTPAKVRGLVAQLSNRDPRVREAAVRQLGATPFLEGKAVRAAMNGGDPEVRRLCKRILRVHHAARYQEVLHAAFHTIRLARPAIKGLAPIMLEALRYCDELYLLQPARQALAATAQPSDVPMLLASLHTDIPDIRIACAMALMNVRGVRAVPELCALLQDSQDGVRLAAAESLTSLNRRAGLPVLVALLESTDARVRFRAAATLRAATGRAFGYVSYLPQKRRAAAAGRWRDFIMKEGARIRLRLPLKLRPRLLGRTLVCTFNTKRIEEYNRAGELTYKSKPLSIPWGCQGLPNGHRLVAVFHARIVVEYNDDGEEVWRSKVLPGEPMSVRRLASGNTLVACSDSKRVVEVKPTGEIAWSALLPGRPIDARRLKNGRTLVTLYKGKRVVEIDRKGTVCWQLSGAGLPSSAQRLPNGNTLVAGLERAGTVTEYDRSGRIVWRATRPGTIYEAQRLHGGNTLIATSKGVSELDISGRVIWNKDVGPCRVMRY